MEKIFIKSPELQKEFVRISNFIISDSEKMIDEKSGNYDELVHSLRKKIKNLRAILKLLRSEVKNDFYKKNNFLLRDINRRSASIRNYFALINLVQSNLKEQQDIKLKETLDLLLTRLNSDFENIRNNTDYSTLFNHYKIQLQKYSQHLNDLDFSNSRFGKMKNGLIKIYSEGKDLQTLCTSEPGNDNLHEWRKSVKEFYYIMYSLIPVWKPVFIAFTKEVKTLSDILGDVNDYFELEHYIKTLTDNPFDFTNLYQLIESNSKYLIEEAYLLGNKIYSLEPESFGDQFKAYYSSFKKSY